MNWRVPDAHLEDATVVSLTVGEVSHVPLRAMGAGALLHTANAERWFDSAETPSDTVWLKIELPGGVDSAELYFGPAPPVWDGAPVEDLEWSGSSGTSSALMLCGTTQGGTLQMAPIGEDQLVDIATDAWPIGVTPLGNARRGGFDSVYGYNWSDPEFGCYVNSTDDIYLRVRVPDETTGVCGVQVFAMPLEDPTWYWWQWQPGDDHAITALQGHGYAWDRSPVPTTVPTVEGALIIASDWHEGYGFGSREVAFGYHPDHGPFYLGSLSPQGVMRDGTADWEPLAWDINSYAGDAGYLAATVLRGNLWKADDDTPAGTSYELDGARYVDVVALSAPGAAPVSTEGAFAPASPATVATPEASVVRWICAIPGRPGSLFVEIYDFVAAAATFYVLDRTTLAVQQTIAGGIVPIPAGYRQHIRGALPSADGTKIEIIVSNEELSGFGDRERFAALYRYDPDTGDVQTVPMSFDMTFHSDTNDPTPDLLGRTSDGRYVFYNQSETYDYMVTQENSPYVYFFRDFPLPVRGSNSRHAVGMTDTHILMGRHTYHASLANYWLDGVQESLGSGQEMYFLEVEQIEIPAVEDPALNGLAPQMTDLAAGLVGDWTFEDCTGEVVEYEGRNVLRVTLDPGVTDGRIVSPPIPYVNEFVNISVLAFSANPGAYIEPRITVYDASDTFLGTNGSSWQMNEPGNPGEAWWTYTGNHPTGAYYVASVEIDNGFAYQYIDFTSITTYQASDLPDSSVVVAPEYLFNIDAAHERDTGSDIGWDAYSDLQNLYELEDWGFEGGTVGSWSGTPALAGTTDPVLSVVADGEEGVNALRVDYGDRGVHLAGPWMEMTGYYIDWYQRMKGSGASVKVSIEWGDGTTAAGNSIDDNLPIDTSYDITDYVETAGAAWADCSHPYEWPYHPVYFDGATHVRIRLTVDDGVPGWFQLDRCGAYAVAGEPTYIEPGPVVWTIDYDYPVLISYGTRYLIAADGFKTSFGPGGGVSALPKLAFDARLGPDATERSYDIGFGSTGLLL